MFERALDKEISARVLIGSRVHFTYREVLTLYRSWQFWLVLTLGLVIMATGHPVTAPQFDIFELRALFWVCALAIYLVLSVPNGLAADFLWKRVSSSPMPIIFSSVAIVACASALAAWCVVAVFEHGRPVGDVLTWPLFLRSMIIAHVFETLALVWLLPQQRARVVQPPARTVTLAGQRFELAQIKRVKAAEHHLELHMLDDVRVVRERMGTFLEQVEDGDGLQTHRSHWIARDCVGGVQGSVMELGCGQTVPVARGRLQAVRAWVEEYGPPTAAAV